jgi:hypothetical protein
MHQNRYDKKLLIWLHYSVWFFEIQKALSLSLPTFFFLDDTMTEDIVYHSTGSKCALSFCKNIYIETGGEGQLSFFSFPKDPVR